MMKLFGCLALAGTVMASAAFAGTGPCANGPAPATAAVPSPPVAQAPQASRAFSYQPSMSYYRSTNGPIMGSYGFRPAASKANGNY